MIARPDSELRSHDAIQIIVSLDAAHSMIALPVEAPAFHVGSDRGGTGADGVSRTPSVYEEWGYAERAWYLEKRQGFTGALRALLWPTEGVVEVGIHESLWAERTQKPPSEAFTFQICEFGYRNLRSYLRATIASEEPVSIVGNSRFCVARSSYHVFHQCHHYTAKGLREAGLPVSMWGALTRDGFARQLRRIMSFSTSHTVPSRFVHASSAGTALVREAGHKFLGSYPGSFLES
jgi:hypothetical protein